MKWLRGFGNVFGKHGNKEGKTAYSYTPKCVHPGTVNFYGVCPARLIGLGIEGKIDLSRYDGWVVLDANQIDSVSDVIDSRKTEMLVLYVRDQGIPTKEQVDRMIDFCTGKKSVLLTCHGGHGRTGTFLAIWMHLMAGKPNEDPIEKVRKLYCIEAVESRAQAQFIYEYLGLVENKEITEKMSKYSGYVSSIYMGDCCKGYYD